MQITRLSNGEIALRTPGGRVAPLTSLPAGAELAPHDLHLGDVLAAPGLMTALAHDLDRLDAAGTDPAIKPLRLGPPVAHPGKILGIALNYSDYCERAGLDRPERPKVFAKFATTVVGPGDPVVVPDGVQATYEGELAVVIGRPARRVAGAEALAAVAGYTIFNDVTAVDWVREDVQLLRGKNADTFGPIGPWLVTKDEIANPDDLPLRTVVDGIERQNSRTSAMVFGVAALIEFLSEFCTLLPGDVIATGTPAGTAPQHEPEAFLTAGQVVSVEIGGLGELSNPITRGAS